MPPRRVPSQGPSSTLPAPSRPTSPDVGGDDEVRGPELLADIMFILFLLVRTISLIM